MKTVGATVRAREATGRQASRRRDVPAPWTALAPSLALALGLLAVGPLAHAQDVAPTPLTVESIEGIVRDYLLREPNVVYEALQELQRREAEAAEERQRMALQENRDRVFDDPSSPVGGNPGGDVTLVEFFDYRCGFCRRVVSSLRALIDDDADLKVVFKELPVLGEDSVLAARAALASARQGRYLDFHFALMDAEDLSEAGVLKVAKRIGLDPDRLLEDMQSEGVQQTLDRNLALARDLGIDGTPAFVVGEDIVPGAIGQAELEERIDQVRAQRS